MSNETRNGPVTRRQVHDLRGLQISHREDTVVTEEPLEIRLGWPGSPARRVAVTMRTPGADFELAAGFLIGERLVSPAGPLESITYCLDSTLTKDQQYNIVTVALSAPPLRDPIARSTAISAACGVCGTQSIDDVLPPEELPVSVSDTIDATLLRELPTALAARQPVFDKTGAVHAAGAFTFAGDLRVIREDVGRHNAVDKVLGARLLGRATFGESTALCVSGRIGFDIVTKAAAGRVSVVVGVGGPTSLALALADRVGITVCGFARGDRCVVYTHPERVTGIE